MSGLSTEQSAVVGLPNGPRKVSQLTEVALCFVCLGVKKDRLHLDIIKLTLTEPLHSTCLQLIFHDGHLKQGRWVRVCVCVCLCHGNIILES